MNKNIKKIVSALKNARTKKTEAKDLNKELTKVLGHPQFRERDMRDEAIDLGSHGAKEMWGRP